jgi:hypothetical protein
VPGRRAEGGSCASSSTARLRTVTHYGEYYDGATYDVVEGAIRKRAWSRSRKWSTGSVSSAGPSDVGTSTRERRSERSARWAVIVEPSATSERLEIRGVYAGSTSLSFEVFGRHCGRARSLDSCGLARLCASCDDA